MRWLLVTIALLAASACLVGWIYLRDRDTNGGRPNATHIGNPDEFTLLELAETIVELTSSKSEIVHEALPIDDPKVRRLDISLAQHLLG